MSVATPFEPARYLTRVNGSDYLEVKWRLVWLRDQHPDATVETGKEFVSAFAWLVAAITVVVYVLLKPERRESLTRFADEAVVQAQELLRDLRGYDDEF